MPPSPPHHEKSTIQAHFFQHFFFAPKNQQIQPSRPPQENSRFYQHLMQKCDNFMSIFSSNSMNLSSVHLKPSHHVKIIFTLHSNFYNLIYTLNSPHAPSTCQLWHTPHPMHLATIIPKKANTYYDQHLTNNQRKKKNHQIFHNKTKYHAHIFDTM